jgi:hypothetical protein
MCHVRLFISKVTYIFSSRMRLSHPLKKTPWPLVRKRTIPTERPPLLGELRIEGVAWSAQRIPLVVNSVLLTGAATFSFK